MPDASSHQSDSFPMTLRCGIAIMNAHRGFVQPGRARPVGIVGVPQQSYAEISGSAPGLFRGPQCVENESWQKPNRANS
jgi:hypothetical protein